MMDNAPLTITGLIATVLSVIFAIAAMLNSRRRRIATRNAAQPKSSDGSDEVDDRPYKIADPFTAIPFTTPAPLAVAQAPAVAPVIPAPLPVTRPAITAFRQLDAHGIEVAPSSSPSDDSYVWE
ncbi:MAG: hypothetical protein WCL16_08755 [bacterium]